MIQYALVNFCDSVCDILSLDLGNEFYAQVSERKNGNLYLRVKKTRKNYEKIIKQIYLP